MVISNSYVSLPEGKLWDVLMGMIGDGIFKWDLVGFGLGFRI